jgi:hypothetical protein
VDVENVKFWKSVSAKSFLCSVKYFKIKNKVLLLNPTVFIHSFIVSIVYSIYILVVLYF